MTIFTVVNILFIFHEYKMSSNHHLQLSVHFPLQPISTLKKNKIKRIIMLKNTKIEVLSGLGFILKFTNLHNKNGVYIKYNKNSDSVKIPDRLIFCLVSLPTLLYTSLFIWIVIEEKFDLKLISVA